MVQTGYGISYKDLRHRIAKTNKSKINYTLLV